jgi:signal transduction histidine kinase
MGLGLYIVKAVVDKHQGWVKVESRIGQGTVVTLTLPTRRL